MAFRRALVGIVATACGARPVTVPPSNQVAPAPAPAASCQPLTLPMSNDDTVHVLQLDGDALTEVDSFVDSGD